MKYTQLDLKEAPSASLVRKLILEAHISIPHTVKSNIPSELFLGMYKNTIQISPKDVDRTRGLEGDAFENWARLDPDRRGSKYPERVRFWASKKSNMPACAFLVDNSIVLPLAFVGEDNLIYLNTRTRTAGQTSIYKAIPLFDSVIKKNLHVTQSLQEIFDFMPQWALERPKLISKLKQATNEPEPVSELDAFNSSIGGHIKQSPVSVTLSTSQGDINPELITKITDDYFADQSNTNSKEEKETMTTSKTIAANMIAANKAAGKDLAYLNAGRVANKTIKSAMTPILKLVMKPSFMQKAFMKLTGAKNPVESFMESPVADLLAAESFKLALEIKGVENAQLQETANKAIVYAGLQLTEKLPIEDLFDEAIAKVADAVSKTSALDKLTNKD